MKGDYHRLGSSYLVEIWIYDIREHEGCKGMIPISSSLIVSSNTNLSGTFICMVGPICYKEKESNHLKSRVKILDLH